MKKISNEIMTGIMVVLCAGLLAFFLFKTGVINFKQDDSYELKAIFNTAGGLEKNAPVMLAGVEVGEVNDIKLDYGNETKIVLTLSLGGKAKVRTDSEASINTLGLMGEKYIEIGRGSAGAAFVEPGATIMGKDPFQFDKLAEKGEQIAETLDETLKDVRIFVNNLNGVVGDNKGGIDNIIVDMEATAKNFKEFSDDIKRHPWKLLIKGKEKKPKKEKKERKKRRR